MATTMSKSKEQKLNTYRGGPDEQGFFGLFGGRFVAETLMPLILDLEQAYDEARGDPAFQRRSTTSTPITAAGRARSISRSA
jgi:tryptophan synthase beta chain